LLTLHKTRSFINETIRYDFQAVVIAQSSNSLNRNVVSVARSYGLQASISGKQFAQVLGQQTLRKSCGGLQHFWNGQFYWLGNSFCSSHNVDAQNIHVSTYTRLVVVMAAATTTLDGLTSICNQNLTSLSL